ncbi:hypothetical protein ZWY2020_037810 [Hordeum vulgare]|nr:hypothetical protein ZWY2020_037810 [Hordeum vulgare]
MTGVTIDANMGFSLCDNTLHAKIRYAAIPVAVEAEKLICRNLGIVQDGRDITKDALQELARRLQHEMSPSMLATLRALFKLDEETATEIEDVLINHGGQTTLYHA